MSDVTLRPMTVAEYDAWYLGAVSEYAEHHIRAGSMPADKAHDIAARQFAELLPDGVATEAHHLLVGEAGGAPIGMLWLNLRTGGERASAFVYDVVVDKDMRGRGYGRALMVAAESYLAPRGGTTIKMPLLGDKTTTLHLYKSPGYIATKTNTTKE
ncbi:MAG: GNAT family N-acetyltransferase, partial [Nocardioidaceae bacterium]